MTLSNKFKRGVAIMKITRVTAKISSLILLLSTLIVPLGMTTASAMSASSTVTSNSTTAAPTTTSYSTNTGTSNGNSIYSVNNSSSYSAYLVSYFIVVGIIYVIVAAGLWKVFVKAGRPGWLAIIPVANTWVLFELGGKSGWWALLMLLPIINIVALVVYVIAILEIARRFGKGVGFAIFGLILFTVVGVPILGFGKSTYNAAS
jgi:hypothetical protein